MAKFKDKVILDALLEALGVELNDVARMTLDGELEITIPEKQEKEEEEEEETEEEESEESEEEESEEEEEESETEVEEEKKEKKESKKKDEGPATKILKNRNKEKDVNVENISKMKDDDFDENRQALFEHVFTGE